MEHRWLAPPRVFNSEPLQIWSGCLPESPQCAVEGCARHAVVVDAFFPYLDDRNRCDFHTLPGLDAPMTPSYKQPRRVHPHGH